MIPDIVADQWKLDRSGATMGRSASGRQAGWPKRTDGQAAASAPHPEGGTDGQPFYQGLEVPYGAVLVQGRRVRRPEGADPAGHRGGPAAAPGAVPAGRGRDRQPASAGDEAEP